MNLVLIFCILHSFNIINYNISVCEDKLNNCINSSKYEIEDLFIPLESQPFSLYIINNEVGVYYYDKSKSSVK